MAQGWISLHRQLQEHWLWDDKPFSMGQAWIDMLLLANHSENEFLLGNELVRVETGSFITSELKLMERWGWSKTKVRSFLNLLQKQHMIVKNSDRKKTTITIEKYSDFQDLETTKKPRKNHRKTTEEPQKDTNNNDNNDNNENNNNNNKACSYVENPLLNETIISFVEFRKSIKKPMNDNAIKLLISKLNKMTPDVNIQIEILNQSIMNGWQGIFPLNRDNKKQSASKNKFNNFEGRNYDMKALERMLTEQRNYKPETDPAFLAEAEALKKELQAKY